MKKLLIVCTLLISSKFLIAADQTEFFSLKDVRLTASPFYEAQQTDLNYLLALDADRLLAPFRKDAHLESIKDAYGNWESDGLDGHIAGHYLSALALMYASTGDERLATRLTYLIDELEKCQISNGDGYLGGVPDGKNVWAELRKGNLNPYNKKWVPWYNLHKLFAGLRDTYTYTHNEKAKKILIQLSDWTLNLTSNLSDEQMQQMLRMEHGGMNEVFVDVARLTGNEKYLKLAKSFSHQAILQPLSKQQDQLTGLHANTQIPKIIGFEKIGEATNDEVYRTAAKYFWQTVVDHRTLAIGGNSVREHFNDPEDYSSLIDNVEGPETCNTYNMLKLTELLYRMESDPVKQSQYSDYYERAVYNHILASQHPDTGGFVYFTPMRPSHFRVYSQVDKAMWCCVGSGLESHAKYGAFIYAHQAKRLLVNLFIPSHLVWKEEHLDLTQSNNFPDDATTKFTFNAKTDVELAIRYPRWVAEGKLQVFINGKLEKINTKPGEYINLKRNWKKGDQVSLQLPMALHLEQMPDKSNYYAVLFGPIVLASKTQPFKNETLNYLADGSRMGHIANAQVCPLEAAPIFISDTPAFTSALKPVEGKPLTFKVEGLIHSDSQENFELIPFFRLHDSRYVIYWPYSTPQGYEQLQVKYAEQKKIEAAIIASTIDQVSPGEQQPEADHYFKSEASESGLNGVRHWRHAFGWMSYQLTDKKGQAKTLRIVYSRLDAGRSFDIFVNDQLIATQLLDNKSKLEFYPIDYVLPPSVRAKASGVLVVKLVAKPNSIAGGIYDVRILKD